MRFKSSLVLSALLSAASARFVMYYDEWHPTRPTDPKDRAGIDHVVLGFAPANNTAAYTPAKVSVSTLRSEFPDAKIMIAVGGWADDIGYMTVSKSDTAIQQFAKDVNTMLTNNAVDGVDIDWEYPGGNGADYLQTSNDAKKYQIEAYPKVLEAIRKAIGQDKILSIAVPGKKGDMMAYTPETGPKIWAQVDFVNVMSYDLINRRDKLSWHHTSVVDSEDTIKNYLAIGAPADKLNLGFAYYAKYVTTKDDCTSASPLNCSLVAAEDAAGRDTKTSGAWTFEKQNMVPFDTKSLPVSTDGTCGPEKGTKCPKGCCSEYGNCGEGPDYCTGACWHAFGTGCTSKDIAASWQQAMAHGVSDDQAGGQYYFDEPNKLFWTWDTPKLITRKFNDIVAKHKLGGVMAWSLGEDGFDYSHIHQMADELKKQPSSPDSNTTVSPTAPASSGYAAPPSKSTDAASSQPAGTPASPSPAPEPTSAAQAPSSYASPPSQNMDAASQPADTPTPSPPAADPTPSSPATDTAAPPPETPIATPPATDTEPAAYSPTYAPPQSETYAAPPSASTAAQASGGSGSGSECECPCPSHTHSAARKGARETGYAHARAHGKYGRAGRRVRG